MKIFTKIFNESGGQVALPTVVLLGGIMIEVIVAGALIVFLFNSSSFGSRLSAEALGAANSGVQDALLLISLNKDFSSGGYTINVGARSTATVIVEKNPIDLGTGKTRVTSLGVALTRNRKIQAIVDVNSVTGATGVESVTEVTL